jgi:hypothetical protein
MFFLRLSMVLLLVGLSGPPSTVCGQPADSAETVQSAVAKRVAGAFSNGDAGRLLNPAADRVEISLFGARTFYSSAQALYVLREFFRTHAPRRFAVRNVMETGTTCLVQGAYEEVRVEQQLRVYVRLDRPEGEAPWHLQEVRIEGASD